MSYSGLEDGRPERPQLGLPLQILVDRNGLCGGTEVAVPLYDSIFQQIGNRFEQNPKKVDAVAKRGAVPILLEDAADRFTEMAVAGTKSEVLCQTHEEFVSLNPGLGDVGVHASKKKKFRSDPVSNCSVFPENILDSESRVAGYSGTGTGSVTEEEFIAIDAAKPLKFSLQQMKVLEAVQEGKSVFLTGSAGSGKSHLLKFVVRILRKKWGPNAVFVTASTGLAACALNGTTVHSFAGVGLGTGSPNTLAAKASGRKECRKRWRTAECLIIDEISMIDGELFDKLDYVARILRSNDRVFGGLQLIVTGDFFQLPPVNPENPRKYFAFQAACWDACFDLQMELSHVFRQPDGGFVNMLNEIRTGTHTEQTFKMFQNFCRDVDTDVPGIAPTRLYPLKTDVRKENESELKALGKEIVNFMSHDWHLRDVHKYMFQNMRSEKVMGLCEGAQVMLIKNLNTESGLVNGARGVVVGFVSHFDSTDSDKKELLYAARIVSPTGKWPLVQFACDGRQRVIGPEKEAVEDGDMEVARRIQVPLILGWALSVHKCQGMTLDMVSTDLSKAFDYGMVYVTLSRVKSLNGLKLTGLDPSRIKVHPNVVRFYENLKVRQLNQSVH